MLSVSPTPRGEVLSLHHRCRHRVRRTLGMLGELTLLWSWAQHLVAARHATVFGGQLPRGHNGPAAVCLSMRPGCIAWSGQARRPVVLLGRLCL